MAETRLERDSMGEMEVPAAAYYGAQTARASRNFEISGMRFPRRFIRALGLIKKAAAESNMGLGLLAPDVGTLIVRAAQDVAWGKHDDQFIVDVFQTGSGTSTNMNANEVIAGLANELATGRRGGRSPVHPNDAVNMGQSSNDVIPTALHLAALEGIRTELLRVLEALQAGLEERSRSLGDVVKIGRTHLQDAVPIRLGQEFSGYAAQVQQGIRRIRDGSEALAELPIGGTAVGTGINAHPEFADGVIAGLSRDTDLPLRPAPNRFEAMANRDAAVEASGALKTVAISLSSIANNIRWLASGPRCGIGEIRIPELQPGSSIMPGKVNPVIPEAVMMVGAQVVGNDATIAWANALGSNFELNVMMPVIIHNLLQSVELLTTAAHHLATRCIDAAHFLKDMKAEGVVRIEADEVRCSDLVERSLAMSTALAPRIGYDNAAALAKLAYHKGRTIRDVATELAGLGPAEIAARLGLPASAATSNAPGGYPGRDELEALLNPRSQTGMRPVGAENGGPADRADPGPGA